MSRRTILTTGFLWIVWNSAAALAAFHAPRIHPPVPPQTLSSDADSSHAWNALHYDLNLTVTPIAVPDSLFISGDLRIEFTPVEANLDTVALHLVGLEVTGAQLNSIPCSWTRVDCLLFVALPAPHQPGEHLFLDLHYSGVPVRTGDLLGGVGIFYPSPTMIYTQADPRGLRNWMPCWDEPWDKATLRQRLTFPSSFTVAANGNLESVVPLGPWTQWTYYMNYPIATYLVSFCASNYAAFEQNAGSVAVKNYVYPQHLTAAQTDLQRVPEMIQTFSEFFGAYPFDTFGYAEAPVFGSGGGAMENQTLVTLGSQLITGTGQYESLFAHELAHMWFGDAAGYLDWPEMWLSEGFATYAEALWAQHLNGLPAYRQAILADQQAYLGWENTLDPHPMYDPPWNIIWSQLTYEKGACVLDMLRYHVGDDAFFQILQDYFAAYRYGNASTEDLAAVVQQATGEDYGWFFDQWVYQAGYPNFEYLATWAPQEDAFLLTLSLAQVQNDRMPRFKSKADLYVFHAQDTLILPFTIEATPTQQLQWTLAVEPDLVQLDPSNHILGFKVRRDDLTGPQLEAADTRILDAGGDGFLDPGESGDLILRLTNSGLPTPDLVAELSSLDAQLIVLEGTRQIPALPFYGQFDFAGDPFRVQNAAGSPSRWVELRLQINEAQSGSSVAALWLYLPVGTPEILLVDDDGGQNYEEKIQQALNGIRRVVRTVEYIAPDSLPPLDDYFGVIWSCGRQLTNTLTPADQALLQAYLNGGGALLLSGRGVVPDLAATDFFQNTLHARAQGTTPIALLNGADPLVEGTSFFISGDGFNQDIVEPDGAPGSSRLLTWFNIGTGGAVKYDGAYKSCVLGFGCEDIQRGNPNFDDPEALLGPLLAWFTGTPGVPPGQSAPLPRLFTVGQNYPNPFNALTAIPISLPQPARVAVSLYNLTGQKVAAAYDGTLNSGQTRILLDASALPSGLYFYRVEANGFNSEGKFSYVGKMVVLK
jgi:hypothetical protein